MQAITSRRPARVMRSHAELRVGAPKHVGPRSVGFAQRRGPLSAAKRRRGRFRRMRDPRVASVNPFVAPVAAGPVVRLQEILLSGIPRRRCAFAHRPSIRVPPRSCRSSDSTHRRPSSGDPRLDHMRRARSRWFPVSLHGPNLGPTVWRHHAAPLPRHKMPAWPPTAPPFVGAGGERITRGAAIRALRAFRRAGVNAERARWALVYGLRHTYATELANANVDEVPGSRVDADITTLCRGCWHRNTFCSSPKPLLRGCRTSSTGRSPLDCR
jgi:hypothetical protein